jgi:hypothetical protein
MTKKRAAGSTRATRGRQATPDRRRRPYEGPVEWLFPRLEETYTRAALFGASQQLFTQGVDRQASAVLGQATDRPPV